MGADPAWPEGHDRIVLETVDSTLNEAQRRFAGGINRPTWILALAQTAARGRRGRPWSMPPGNFAATLILPTTERPDRIALRSFTTSLALFDACVGATGRTEGLALKWPNDVLLNGGKLAGILLETLQSGGRTAGAAIGIGVNLASAPEVSEVEERALRPVALTGMGASPPPEDFLELLAQAFDRYETQFRHYGFAPIRTAWLDRAAHLGEVITARTGMSETTGRFETIDETGQLVLSTDGSRRTIAAADIYF
ncbi:biotin--acetyl-CoA-carboxylase ligase [Pseudooceanicola batsensis HTCC2597]|uniref:biotin--[biotin carboxyl-carrier protein] ligase n=1 Tax=Pseudooceanicola batsensis (strain ATCC BAA-863 / DSM 15984 / KCTC 12145 / HTCC2597) TaxID=252305 RepID=A3U1P2_PSEBH|nr:biotin--[acetyl-CoA-carboxylase] ligase [Pseudooceanicola batsensis]EAQ01823.1 biotin--acetyl-CoA-carboxylase ligase [Pseudooceanicola batsensis HTCC2597]